MTDETLIFKIIELTEDGDCVAVTENGKEILVDPFVGCAFEYEQRENLLNAWWRASGHWNTLYDIHAEKEVTVFLVDENEFHLLTPSTNEPRK